MKEAGQSLGSFSQSFLKECVFVKAVWLCTKTAFFTGSILDWSISVMTATHSVFMPTMTGGFLPIFFYAGRKCNPFETAWRSFLPIVLVTSRRACSLVRRQWPSGPALLSAATESLCRRWALHGLTHAQGARADRFICTQSQRTAASHSNCISAHGEGKDPAVHITVAEANLAEMEGEMEKAHLLH